MLLCLFACGGDSDDANCPTCAQSENKVGIPYITFSFKHPLDIGTEVVLDGQYSQPYPGNTPVDYIWKITSPPGSNVNKIIQEPGDPNFIGRFTPDIPGSYTISLQLTDGSLVSHPKYETITIGMPQANIVVETYSPYVGSVVLLDGKNSIPYNTIKHFMWTIISKPNGSQATLNYPYNNHVKPFFTADIHGSYIIQLKVSNGQLTSPPTIVEIKTVEYLGPIPIIQFLNSNQPTIGDKVLIDGSKSCPGPGSQQIDEYQWLFVSKPNGSNSVLDIPAHDPSKPSFTVDRPGIYTIQLIVNDGIKDSFAQRANLPTVEYDAPIARIKVLSSQPEVGSIINLDGSLSVYSKFSTGIKAYTWEIINKPTNSQTLLEYKNNDKVKPYFTPDKPGQYEIQLSVDDGIQISPPTTVKIQTVNSKPVALIMTRNTQPILVMDTVLLDGSSSFDPDGTHLVYKWAIQKPSGSQATISNPGAISPSFLADRPGQYIVSLVVYDGELNSVPHVLTITTANSKPVAKARRISLNPQDPIFENQVVQLDASQSSDVDDDLLTYQWEITEKPNGSNASIYDELQVKASFIPDIPGDYSIRLIVNDGKLNSLPDYLYLTVKEIIDLEPLEIETGNVIVDPNTLNVSGSIQFKIRNNGTRIVNTTYRILLFEDKNKDGQYNQNDDTVLAEKDIYNKPDGNSTVSESANVKADAKMSFRDNLIYVFVDSEKVIDEQDETNNITHSMADQICEPPKRALEPVLEWEWSATSVNYRSVQVMCTPVVANLNDDNNDGKIDQKDIPDIIFNTFSDTYDRNGALRAISGYDGSELFYVYDFSNNGEIYHAGPTFNPAVGDIDNDGLAEIVLVVIWQDLKRIAAVENDGQIKWITPNYSSSQRLPDGSINIADLDNDGVPEIIGGNIVLNSIDGTTRWIGAKEDGLNNSIVLDVDYDEKLEVIAGCTAYRYDGSILWNNKLLKNGYTAAANFNDDPYPEIALVAQGEIYLLEGRTGKIIWGPEMIPPGVILDNHGGLPVIADFDGDGKPEIGVAGGTRYVVFKHDGAILWSTEINDKSATTGSSVFDFEGDGRAEVIYRDENALRIFDGSDGTVLFEILMGSGTIIEMPIVVDVDNDNSAEIVIGCNSYINGNKTGIYVFGDANDNWVNTRKIWNQQAYCITNVTDDGKIPAFPNKNWNIPQFNNFRQNQMLNPFGCKDITAGEIKAYTNIGMNYAVFSVVVGNGGAVHISKGVKIAFYDGTVQHPNYLMGTEELSEDLYPGETEEVYFKLSSTYKPGWHTIIAVADEYLDSKTGLLKGDLREYREQNNKVQKMFYLP